MINFSATKQRPATSGDVIQSLRLLVGSIVNNDFSLIKHKDSGHTTDDSGQQRRRLY
jgi:hypothetical protein